MVSGAGNVISGASSVLSSGISYLGWKGAEQQPKGYTGGTTKMMGFGSNDSYSGYMGGTGSGSTNYAPPGGDKSSYA